MNQYASIEALNPRIHLFNRSVPKYPPRFRRTNMSNCLVKFYPCRIQVRFFSLLPFDLDFNEMMCVWIFLPLNWQTEFLLLSQLTDADRYREPGRDKNCSQRKKDFKVTFSPMIWSSCFFASFCPASSFIRSLHHFISRQHTRRRRGSWPWNSRKEVGSTG